MDNETDQRAAVGGRGHESGGRDAVVEVGWWRRRRRFIGSSLSVLGAAAILAGGCSAPKIGDEAPFEERELGEILDAIDDVEGIDGCSVDLLTARRRTSDYSIRFADVGECDYETPARNDQLAADSFTSKEARNEALYDTAGGMLRSCDWDLVASFGTYVLHGGDDVTPEIVEAVASVPGAVVFCPS